MKDSKLKIDSNNNRYDCDLKVTQISSSSANDNLSEMQAFTISQGNIIIKLLSILVTLALVALLIVTITTLHLHISPDNQIYIHSHPMDDNGKSGNHSHSQSEYIFFNFIKTLLYKILTMSIVVITILYICRHFINLQSIGFAYSGYHCSYQDRAPPIFFLN